MKKNVGNLDRILRIVVGLALLLGFFLNPGASLRCKGANSASRSLMRTDRHG